MSDARHTQRMAAMRAANDAFRRAGPTETWRAADGVWQRGSVFLALAYRRIMTSTVFSCAHDPVGLHRAGFVTVATVPLLWRIVSASDAADIGSSSHGERALLLTHATARCIRCINA